MLLYTFIYFYMLFSQERQHPLYLISFVFTFFHVLFTLTTYRLLIGVLSFIQVKRKTKKIKTCLHKDIVYRRLKMKKRNKKAIIAILAAGVLASSFMLTACGTSTDAGNDTSTEGAPSDKGAPPEGKGGGPGENGGGPGGVSAEDVSWKGATTITEATETSDETYDSSSEDENSVLVDTSDEVTLNNVTVTKTGGTESTDTYSFFGINSGIMVKGGSTTNITGGTITTDAAGANGVFSYGANSGQTNSEGDGTTVNISDVTIATSGDGSGGIMTTYGGTTNATNLTVTTQGRSSAAIRTDRGGGWVTVDGGYYESNGQGSPAIYSTADVDVSNATLVSNQSEGVCIEGAGSIELTDCDLTANNTTLNGNATFYDTIMIYQSQSGDASDGTSEFTMTGGSLTSKNGDTFHVTNTTSTINLEDVEISTAEGGALLTVCDDGWDGAENAVTLNAKNQTLTGDLLVGDNSSLTLNLTDGSTFTGAISGEITNGSGETVSTEVGTVDVTIDEGSTWVLTEDCSISSLSGDGNIDYNGHTLTVDGTVYSN